MNVVSGSTLFRPTSGQAGQTHAPRPAPATNAVLQAQAAGEERRAQAARDGEARPPAAHNPRAPRGSIIDIVA